MKKLKQIFNFINSHPLANRHKVKSYFRFFKWQISQSIYPHDVIYKFIEPTKLIVRKGLTGVTGNIYTGLHDFSEMGFLIHFLRNKDLFFDVGANVGSYSILAAGCKRAKVVAFEPVHSTYFKLVKNIEINGLSELIKAYQIGLGNKKGILKFTRSYDTVNHVVLDDKNSYSEELSEISVDEFDNIAVVEGVPDIVKIDVEGFETEVLNGMIQTLNSPKLKVIIIELNGSGARYGFDDNIIHHNLLTANFLPYYYEPFDRTLTLMESYGQSNTIYIRDIDFVNNRIATASKFKVFSELI